MPTMNSEDRHQDTSLQVSLFRQMEKSHRTCVYYPTIDYGESKGDALIKRNLRAAYGRLSARFRASSHAAALHLEESDKCIWVRSEADLGTCLNAERHHHYGNR